MHVVCPIWWTTCMIKDDHFGRMELFMSLLEMNGICKSFNGIQVLKEVSLRVEAGEVHALLGENGAGKSTLMNILTGVHDKDAGTVVFDGKEMKNISVKSSENAGIAFVHQELNLFNDLKVYENIFLHYTMKQWGQTPEQIDPAVTGRVPVLISHDNRYFQEPWQGMPLHGYTLMFEKMLDHENITVEIGVDARSRVTFSEGSVSLDGQAFTGDVIYTGPLDELFDCRFGRLPYRSLRFDFEYYDKPDYQGHSVVNYTVSEDFTRITEFKYLTGQQAEGTTIVKEYPFAYTGAAGEIPYYSIANEANQKLYEQYRGLVAVLLGAEGG